MTQRTAERPAGMNLDWTNTSEDTWQADLPAIPGYTGADGNGSFVTVVYNGNTELAVPYDADCTIFLSQGGVVNLNLWDMWAFDPFGPDAKDVMQAVDDLGVSDISDELKRMGYESTDATASRHASREPRHATHRTAGMNLDWEQDDVAGSWFADLPTIPGYPCADGYSNHVQVADQSGLEGTDWAFYMYLELQKEPVHLYNEDFDISDTDTAEEMMDIVDNLSVQDIADALQSAGYMPEDATASRKPRHASRRTAHMDLDWEKNVDVYVAQLPAIPGYQGSYPDEVRVASRPKDDDVWLFEMLIGVGDKQVPLYNYDFGIPYGGSADEMMDAVENLDPQDIADVLAENGYMPDED